MNTEYVCRGLIGLYVIFHNNRTMWSTNLHVKICRWGGGGGGGEEKEPKTTPPKQRYQWHLINRKNQSSHKIPKLFVLRKMILIKL